MRRELEPTPPGPYGWSGGMVDQADADADAVADPAPVPRAEPMLLVDPPKLALSCRRKGVVTTGGWDWEWEWGAVYGDCDKSEVVRNCCGV